MRKKIKLLLGCIVFLLYGNAQQLKPSIIATDGGVSSSETVSLEWTLGEFAIETISGSGNLFTQGFHQPVLMAKKTSFNNQQVVLENSNNYRILLAPNPSRSFVNVFINSDENENHVFSLFDLSGKKILVKQGSGKDYSMRIEMASLASGMYLLDIRDRKGRMIESFKIVKAD